jgi:nicotinate-nucleotide adenylyltransferase
MPTRALRLLVGADVLADLPKWHRFDKIAELAPPIVMGREGIADERAPPPLLPAVSSTEIRAALAGGDIERVRHLVPRAVLQYIDRHHLYRGEA